jgi:hypothetical protein
MCDKCAALTAEIAFLHRTITETQDIGLLARIKELTEALEKIESMATIETVEIQNIAQAALGGK